MKGDFTKLTFKPEKHYRAVLMQQGRVQLDSDWNEQVQIAEHRYTTLFTDFVGRCGTKGNDMRVQIVAGSSTKLCIAKGNFYVDGLLVENEAQLELDLAGKADGCYLIYLDAWERHITAAEDPDLLEPALGGPDTTTRIKTEWKIRCEKVNGDTLEEARDAYTQAGWPWPAQYDWQQPLGTGTMALQRVTLQVPDHRLYRVEYHGIDPTNQQPRFKWSRDNGSAVAPVTIQGSTAALQSLNLQVLEAFRGAICVELTSAGHEANGRSGAMATPDLSELDNGLISLTWIDAAPNLADFGNTLFIRRWDGVFSVNLSTGNSAFVELELGLKTSFSKGFYRPGDYWLIPVRSGIARDWITTPAPQFQNAEGVTHHYAALAVVQMAYGKIVLDSNSLPLRSDLRLLFQPLTSKDLSTAENFCIGGKVGIGFLDTTKLHAPLNILRATSGKLLELQGASGSPVWAINDMKTGKALYIGPASQNSSSGGLSVGNTGNIGIGTDNPLYRLQVVGTGNFGKEDSNGLSEPGGVPLVVQGKGTVFGAHNSLGHQAFALNIEGDMDKDHRGVVKLYDKYDGNWHSSLSLKKGNVGINMDDPSYKLMLALSGKSSDGIIIDSGDKNKAIALLCNNGLSAWNPLTQPGDHLLLWKGDKLDTPGAGLVIAPWRSSASGMRIDEKGNIGIGTSQPQAKLEVDSGNSNKLTALRLSGSGTFGACLELNDTEKNGKNYSISSSLGRLMFLDGTPYKCFTLDRNGNIGIATQFPQAALHINHLDLNKVPSIIIEKNAYYNYTDEQLNKSINDLPSSSLMLVIKDYQLDLYFKTNNNDIYLYSIIGKPYKTAIN